MQHEISKSKCTQWATPKVHLWNKVSVTAPTSRQVVSGGQCCKSSLPVVFSQVNSKCKMSECHRRHQQPKAFAQRQAHRCCPTFSHSLMCYTLLNTFQLEFISNARPCSSGSRNSTPDSGIKVADAPVYRNGDIALLSTCLFLALLQYAAKLATQPLRSILHSVALTLTFCPASKQQFVSFTVTCIKLSTRSKRPLTK